ncbi:hypothetical protein BDW62DRAFT_87632 [Aspergillus aurantiobrunneus]
MRQTAAEACKLTTFTMLVVHSIYSGSPLQMVVGVQALAGSVDLSPGWGCCLFSVQCLLSIYCYIVLTLQLACSAT